MAVTEDDVTRGKRFAFARVAAGFTQQEVAERLRAKGLKTDKSKVSRWETGENRPRKGTLVLVAELYNTTAPWLDYGAGAPPVRKERDYPEPQNAEPANIAEPRASYDVDTYSATVNEALVRIATGDVEPAPTAAELRELRRAALEDYAGKSVAHLIGLLERHLLFVVRSKSKVASPRERAARDQAAQPELGDIAPFTPTPKRKDRKS